MQCVLILSLFQCSALLDDKSRDLFVEDVNEEYEEMRQDHYDNLKVSGVFY